MGITTTANGGKQTAVIAKAKEVQAVLRAAHGGQESVLSRVGLRLPWGWLPIISTYYHLRRDSRRLDAGRFSLAGAFLLAYALMLYADRRMSSVFSQFWHKAPPQLRKALKQSRMTALERYEGGMTANH